MIKRIKSIEWWLEIILIWVIQFECFLGRVHDEWKVKATQPEARVMAAMLPVIFTVGQRKKVTAVTFFPARPRPDQRSTNTGQIRKVPVYEITWFLVYRMGETRSQLGANNGILVCLVREIWQFKLFAGKEVTAVPVTRGEEVTHGEDEGYCACVETE